MTPLSDISTVLFESAPRGWVTIGFIVAGLAAKALVRAIFPEGWHFKFVEKFLVDDDEPKKPKGEDE